MSLLKGLGRFIGGMLLLIARVGMVGLVTLFLAALVWEYSWTEPGDGFPWIMWTLWWLGTALWVLPGRRHMITKFLVLTLAIGAVSPILLPSSESTDHRAQRCLDACPGAGLEETRYFACAQACEEKKARNDLDRICKWRMLFDKNAWCDSAEARMMRHDTGKLHQRLEAGHPGFTKWVDYFLTIEP